jgi:hypothetical protein
MRDLFDKSFAFAQAVPDADLTRVRKSLVDHLIPNDGSFNPDTVDQVMATISAAAPLAPPERFERLVALKEFGADTIALEILKDAQLSKVAEAALSAEAPAGGFHSTELKAGWEKAISRYAMSSWLEDKKAQREDIMRALNPFLPATIGCDYYCVEEPGGRIVSGPFCLSPGQPPPCPRYHDPFSGWPYPMR